MIKRMYNFVKFRIAPIQLRFLTYLLKSGTVGHASGYTDAPFALAVCSDNPDYPQIEMA
jgi:hypothetical protein